MTGYEGQQAVTDKGLSEDEFKRLIASEIQNAMAYLDTSEGITSERYRNAEYYRGIMDDLPAARGQSSVVSSEVSDYIGMMLPSLLRPFTSGDKLFSYANPQGLSDETTKVITQYINEVAFKKDNRGEIVLNNWAFDGLVQKNGVVKVWWEEEETIREQNYQGLTDKDYLLLSAQLAMDPSKQITAYQKDDGADPTKPTHDITLRKTTNSSHACFDVIPIDEFIISRDARNTESAILRCHRTWEVAGDLISEGYDASIISNLPTYVDFRANMTRPGAANREQNRQNQVDPALRKVTVYEGIIRCNRDGTGVREWYFKAAGQDGGVYILEDALYDAQVFFCDFCPEPIPHQFVGTCPADRLSQIQRVNTVLTRQALQNLYLSNAPQRIVVADQILSPDQLTNFAAGASIMTTSPTAVTNMPLPFTAQYAFEAISYFDSKAADRTGVSRTSAGLDPDALQNQSATGANLAWNASMGRMEMVARIWAYTGMRQLGVALLRTIIAYQNFPRTVIMGDKPVTVDPRQWGPYAEMEVTVTTGLGTGHRDRDMVVLNNLLNLQTSTMEKLGPNNPIVSFEKIGNTLQMIATCGGISNPESVFGAVPPGWMPQPAPPPPPPQIVAAQIKAQSDQATAQQNLQGKMADIAAKSQLKLREQDIQAMLAVMEEILNHAHHKDEMKIDTNLPTAYRGTGT